MTMSAARALVERTTAAQGVPVHVDDVRALERVARLIAGADDRAEAQVAA